MSESILKGKKKKSVPHYKVTLSIEPVGCEFFGSKEKTVFSRNFTIQYPVMTILDVCHYGFWKNACQDNDNLKVVNNVEV